MRIVVEIHTVFTVELKEFNKYCYLLIRANLEAIKTTIDLAKNRYYAEEKGKELIMSPYIDYNYAYRGSNKSLEMWAEWSAIQFDIKKVIFNAPATIVIWTDGTKTVVKCGDEDVYDPEKGLAMCFTKRALGNKGNYYNTIKKHLKESRIELQSSNEDVWDSIVYIIKQSFKKH